MRIAKLIARCLILFCLTACVGSQALEHSVQKKDKGAVGAIRVYSSERKGFIMTNKVNKTEA